MRKITKHAVFLFLCLLFGSVYGQGTGTLYRALIGGTDNLIRYANSHDRYIAYARFQTGENHFSLTDLSTMIDVKVSDNLKVTDFEVIGNIVFFCGHDATSTSGFIGWFDIDSLFYMGVPAHIDQTLSVLGLKTLDDIEVYYDPSGKIRIAGYGIHNYLTSYNDEYQAFEAIGTVTTGFQYRTLDFPSFFGGHITDVVVTDNIVVYLLQARNQACPPWVGIGITLLPFPKYNMFGSTMYYRHNFQTISFSPMWAPGYVVPIEDDPYGDVPPLMVHSQGDELAVCSYRLDLDENTFKPPILPNDPCGIFPTPMMTHITHRVFDLSQLQYGLNYPVLMTSNLKAQLNPYKALSIDGFIYEPQTHQYLVLHRHETSSGIEEHAVTTIDFGAGTPPTAFWSSYQTLYNTSSNWRPCNMCLEGYPYYTVVGYDNMGGQYLFWRNSVNPRSEECDNVLKYLVDPLPNDVEKCDYYYSTPTVWTPLSFEDGAADIQNSVLEIICD